MEGIFSTLIRVHLKNSYWIDKKAGFKIVNPAIQNDTNLYCKVSEKKITGFIEVHEDRATGKETILNKGGNYKAVKNYFLI